MSSDFAVKPSALGDQDALWLLVIGQVMWMSVPWLVLSDVTVWTLERYFVVSFVGLLVLRLMVLPEGEPPTWWNRLNWVVRGGYVVLLLIVIERILVFY